LKAGGRRQKAEGRRQKAEGVLMKKFFHHQVMKIGSCLLPVVCCLFPTFKSGNSDGIKLV